MAKIISEVNLKLLTTVKVVNVNKLLFAATKQSHCNSYSLCIRLGN